jgi:nucleoside phosphorylase
MNILLIDDEYDKVAAVHAALKESGLDDVVIVHRSNAHEARILIRKTQFDFLIIDLNLPAVVGDKPQPDGGLQFFDLIQADVLAKLPLDIIFLTGREDLLEDAEQKAILRGAQLFHYSVGKTKWKSNLVSRVKYRHMQISRLDPGYPVVDVAIVCALRKTELEAVLALPYNWKVVRYCNNAMTYHVGEIRLESRTISVLAAAAHSKGMPSAAALSAQICILFRPKYIVMLGICAGVHGRTNFGDVLVADPAWDWGSGKITQAENGERVFLSAPQQRPLDTKISQVVRELALSAAVLNRIKSGWNERSPDTVLQIHVGPVASGASVLANGATMKEITIQHRELLGIEMECYAVLTAAEYGFMPIPKAIAIKSVCDFADVEKNDDWQRYAAYTSAMFFDQLFRSEYLDL